jgi:hypothetical protein
VIVTDILATGYVLLDNASEAELNYVVSLELLGSVLNVMRQEQILGNLDDIITKSEVTFSDSTGLLTNSLTEFGDVVYLEFNGDPIDECPVTMLDLYASQGLQRVAFWKDSAASNAAKIQLAIPQMGTLKIWYEREKVETNQPDDTVSFPESLRWCIACRWAEAAIDYVKFADPMKTANKATVKGSLSQMAKKWETIYLTKINKIGTGRPFSRLPFSAGTITG